MSSATIIPKGRGTAQEDVNVLPEVFALKEEMQTNRRWFHQYPEFSFKEFKTAAKVVELLKSYGIVNITEKVGKTGVVALIEGALPGPCVALRADMDGLPVTESADIEYQSRHEGFMHACGHDGHMSALLAAAKLLHAKRDTMKGSVKLIFQPAEEGYGGAKFMIEDGCLENPHVDYIYGIHLWSYSLLGEVGVKEGPIMAASDRFYIDVHGKGGHGAAPHGTVDAIVEAASLITNLQTVVSRNKAPLESGVITVGTIKGGFGYNIIADKVELCGTCRSFKPDVQELMKTRMNDVCCGTASTFGGSIDFRYEYGYPPTINAYPEEVELVQKAGETIVGHVRSRVPVVTMGAEDFSYFLQKRPGCFFFVGAALQGEVRPHHKSVFDFDEDAMMISASMFMRICELRLFE
jgi:amidohydrolase